MKFCIFGTEKSGIKNGVVFSEGRTELFTVECYGGFYRDHEREEIWIGSWMDTSGLIDIQNSTSMYPISIFICNQIL